MIIPVTSPKLKNAIVTLIYYIILVSIILILGNIKSLRGGPCNPSIAIILYGLAGPLTIIHILRNAHQTLLNRSPNGYSLAIHLIAFGLWILILSF